MTVFSASQAAKETGLSVPTITRAIKSGKISGRKLDGGGYEIEPSELFRVFPRVTPVSDVTHNKLGHETLVETKVLEVKLEAKDKEIALLISERDDLRRRLDEEATERRKLTMILTDQSAPKPAPEPEPAITQPPVIEEAPKRSWWGFGKAKA